MPSSIPSMSRPTSFDSRLNAATANIRRSMQRLGLVIAGMALCGAGVQAQTAAPIVLPNTYSTVAGSANGSAGVSGFTVGSACSPGSPYKATDVYGDGCPATQAVFGTDLQDGVRVDGQGNIWIADINNNWAGTSIVLLRKVDGKSGIVSLIASSANGNCTLATATTGGAMDSAGDGCPFANTKAPKERGWGMDPYGNLLAGSYTSGEVHIYCNAVSPLCPIAAGVTQTYSSAQKQVGNVYRIAGCVQTGTTATAGTTIVAPGSGDGYFASSFWNLPGDVAAWGAANSGFSATAGVTGTAGTCNPTTSGEINGVRSVTADQYGNVYISDGTNLRARVIVGPATYTLPGGTVLTNPLPSVISLYPAYASVTPAQMYGRIYPIVGGFPASTAGAACASAATATSADAYGDGCPWYNTSQTNANPVGLAIDNTTEGGTVSPNFVLLDGAINALRVLYMGPTVSAGNITAASYPMANAILANNPTATAVTHGYVYLLAGNSVGVTTAAPTLGVQNSMTGYGRVAAAPSGNLYLAKSSTSTTPSTVSFYDLSTGSVRLLAQSTLSATSAITVVPGTTATSTFVCATPGAGDGQPAFATSSTYSTAALTTNGCFNNNGTGSSQLSVAADANNNLYIADVEIDAAGYGRSRIRELLATQMYPATLGTPVTQSLYLHGPAGTAASATAIAASVLNASPSEISVGTPACATTANADNTVDCLANVTFSPAAPGLRAGSLILTEASPAVSSNFSLSGLATGSALVTDPALPVAPITTSLLGASAVPVGVAVSSRGDVFTMDTKAGKFTQVSGGTTTQLAGALPANPTQLALDLFGNLYAAGTGNATLTKLTLKGSIYTASTVSIAGVTAPQAATVDALGNLYVADKTTGSVYKIAAASVTGSALPGSNGLLPNFTPPVVVATGLSSPTGLAIDGLGDLYIGDSGAGSIIRVDAKSGATTTLLSGIHPVSIAVDAAGDVYYQDNTAQTVVEIPYSSILNGVAGSTSVTILGSMSAPSGLAIAGNGNLYSADSGAGTLKLLARSAFTFNFGVGSAGSPTLNGTLTNVGNQAATGSNPAAASNNLVVSGSGSNACPFTSNVLGPQAAGNACTFNASFVGLGSAAVSSVVSYLPASTVGSLSLGGTLTAVSGTTTNLASVGTTALPGVTITLTATVASTAAVAGQTVTFLNGTTTLGTGTTNASGVATYTLSAGALGTVYTFKATFAGTTTLGSSASATQTVTVALTPTSIALSISTTSTYPNQPVTLTATQTPAAVGQTISFLNGTTTLGTGTISAAGVATYVFTPTAGGVYSLKASFPADGKVYAASASSVQTLTISNSAVLFSTSVSAVTIAPGGSGQITLSMTAAGGFAGQVSLSCKSPVAYVTCALTLPVVDITQNPNTTATITVAFTTSSLRTPNNGLYVAMLTPFGLLGLAFGFGTRKRLPRVALLILLVACGGVMACGVTGCSTANAGATGTAPSGTQVVTFTATAAGGSQSVPVTVTIQ